MINLSCIDAFLASHRASLRLEVDQLRAEILVLICSLAALQHSVLRFMPTERAAGGDVHAAPERSGSPTPHVPPDLSGAAPAAGVEAEPEGPPRNEECEAVVATSAVASRSSSKARSSASASSAEVRAWVLHAFPGHSEADDDDPPAEFSIHYSEYPVVTARYSDTAKVARLFFVATGFL